MKIKIILEHLKKNREVLLNYSRLIALAQHKTILGTAREALISGFLEKNLPEFISYHSGEIFDSENKRSGQIDIILHPITSPKLNLYGTINMFPVETVLGAIEVKSVLNAKSISEALHNCYLTKDLDTPSINESPYINSFGTSYIVFGFHGPTEKTLLSNIENYIEKNKGKMKHYGLLPDLIVVLSVGKNELSYCLKKSPGALSAGIEFNEVYKKIYSNDEVLVGPFQYILRKVESWFRAPDKRYMPLSKYITDPPSLKKFFKGFE